MAHCPHFSTVAWRRAKDGKIHVRRLACGSWQCGYCQQKNREMWRRHLARRLHVVADRWWFVTLTLRNHHSADYGIGVLRRGVDLLLKRARRVWDGIEYVRVFERHETGVYHAHMLIAGLSDRVEWQRAKNGKVSYRPTTRAGRGTWALKTWVKKISPDVGLGYIADVQPVAENTAVTKYVTKYMTKEAQQFFVKGLRRIQTSRGIGAANPRKKSGDDEWRVGRRLYAHEVDDTPVYDDDAKMMVSPEYWRVWGVYPPPNPNEKPSYS